MPDDVDMPRVKALPPVVRLLATVTAAAMAMPLLVTPPSLAQASTKGPYISSTVPVADGCIVLSRAWAGVKVALVQRRLGTTHELDRYGNATFAAVKSFQERNGLTESGRVDRATWGALGIDRRFCMDRFTVQPTVTSPGSPKKRVKAMIAWARAQVGRPYIWGGAGPVGYDCSGLALQAMHAGGRVLPSVTTYLHQRRDFPTASRIFDSGLPRRPLAERRPGDLVFFGAPGSISHMGIYLGHGRIVEAVRPNVQIASMWNRQTPIKARVVRPFGR
jgi:cell wall-associated NlpC family hydrolase